MNRYLILLALLFSFPAFALNINVTGNSKTSTSYVKNIAEKCIRNQTSERNIPINEERETLSPEILPAVKQCIYNYRIFAEVELALQGNNLTITIQDKWTVIPIPILQAGNGIKPRYGLLLLDTNFLGEGITFGIGSSYSKQGYSLFSFWQDTSLFGTNWQYTLSGTKSNDAIVLFEGKKESYAFQDKSIGSASAIGYKLGYSTIGMGFARKIKQFSVLKDYTPPDANNSNSISIFVNYDKSDFKLYLSEGINCKLGFSTELNRTDTHSLYKQIDYSFLWQQESSLNTAVILMAQGGQSFGGAEFDGFRIGYQRGFRGIKNRSILGKNYFTTAIELQHVLKKYSLGTWTVGPFADFGEIQHNFGNKSKLQFMSTGLGTYYFIRKIAVPGMGFEAGYNNTYQGWFVNFSVGSTI